MGSMTTLKQAAELCAQEFTVHYEDGSETIWVRTRTMPEVAQAEEEIAARKLALREKYRVGTTHYQAEVSGLEMESYPNLVGIVLSGETESLAERARRAVPMPMRPATYRNGGDSEEKEVREYEERQEKYEGMVAAKLSEILSDRETALLQEPKEKLVEMAIGPRLRMLVEFEATSLAHCQLIRDSVRRGDDHGQPYFDSTDEIIVLPPQILASLLAAIRTVDAMRAVDIKNSQGRSVLWIGSADDTQEPTTDRSTVGLAASSSPRKNSPGGRKRRSKG